MQREQLPNGVTRIHNMYFNTLKKQEKEKDAKVVINSVFALAKL